jgi:hypothetical protein
MKARKSNEVFSKTGLVAAMALVLGAAFVSPAAPAATTLLLSQRRVEVSVTWRNQYDGSTGTGTSIPVSDVFGFFAFTDPANPEVFVKVLDFGPERPLLLFYGGLTNFEYRLTFHNRCTGQDVVKVKAPNTFDGGVDATSMVAGCPVGPAAAVGEESASFVRSSAAVPNLSLSKGRVSVSLTWRNQYDGSTGVSIATPINDNFGFLSFTDPANPEVFVKVLDFGSQQPLLLFYGGLTDLEYQVTYRNVCSSQSVVVTKPPYNTGGGADTTSMFATCDQPPAAAALLAIQSVEARCRSLSAQGVSRLEWVRGVAAFMATLPAYRATGVDEDSLTAFGILQNGASHFVVNNREANAPSTLPGLQAAEKVAFASSGPEIPVSGWARLLQSFTSDRLSGPPVNDIASWLENPGGYAIRGGQDGEASLATLRNVKGDGFLYFNTHGGRAPQVQDLNQTHPRVFSLQSSTLVTAASEQQPDIVADLAANRLTYFTAPNGTFQPDPATGVSTAVSDTRYGITGDFVRTYWQLSPNSIVFLNACFSAYTANPDGPQQFIDACWSAGAGAYFGWNWVSNSDTCFKTVRYFVDRLVGANKYQKENPNQRAFPWDLVYQDMASHGLTHDAITGANLVALGRPGGPSSILLDPSIKEVLVDEYAGKVKLEGYFGSQAGKVTIGAKELSGCTWGNDEIVCTLPLTGAGSSGDVYAIVPGEMGAERKSNARQLTEWKIPLHYLWTNAYDYPGLKFEGNGNLRLRADVGSYREKPGASPYFPVRGMIPTKDSSLPLTGSGSSTSGSCTTTLSGSGTFPAEAYGGGAPLALVLASAAKVDTNSRQGAIGLGFGAAAGAIPFRITFSGPNCSGSNPAAPAFGLMEGPEMFPSPLDDTSLFFGPLPAVLVSFDSGFNLLQRKYTDGRFGGTLTVEWQGIVAPISPPKIDAAR